MQETLPENIENEVADARSQKMSDRVRIQRWPSDGPVVGPALMVVPLDQAVKGLYESNFMRPWIERQIKEHLLNGETFTNRGRNVSENEAAIVPNGEQVAVRARSEYRMATELEVLNWVDVAQFATASGRTISKRAQEKAYVLHAYEGAKLIALYDNLPRQAKVMIDLLNEAGRDTFTEASIEVILSSQAAIEKLKTTQKPMLIFGFYRKRLIEEGHLEEVEDVKGVGEAQESEED
jgi:hypothetical protein